MPYARLEPAGAAEVLRQPDTSDARVLVQQRAGCVLAGIVHDDHRIRPARLAQHGLKALPKQRGPVTGDDNGNHARLAHLGDAEQRRMAGWAKLQQFRAPAFLWSSRCRTMAYDLCYLDHVGSVSNAKVILYYGRVRPFWNSWTEQPAQMRLLPI